MVFVVSFIISFSLAVQQFSDPVYFPRLVLIILFIPQLFFSGFFLRLFLSSFVSLFLLLRAYYVFMFHSSNFILFVCVLFRAL